MRALLVAGLLVVSSGAASPGIGQAPDRPIVSSRTDVVVLPVTVLDRDQRLVTGLGREHFTIYDNGEAQALQFFSNEDAPWTVGLVIDQSGSMRGMRDAVTAAASAFAAGSGRFDELFTLNFNEMVWPGLPPNVPFAQSVGQLRVALAAPPVRGMTALHDAVHRGLDHLQRGTHDRMALIVVSDGGDNASGRTFDEVLERARRTSAAIYTIVLADPDDDEARPGVLKALARETGGRAFTPKRVGDVALAFAAIDGEMRGGYTLGFSPSSRGAGFRRIRVTVDAGDGRRLAARTRAGYYAGRTNGDR
jgi:VWFA-related protein